MTVFHFPMETAGDAVFVYCAVQSVQQIIDDDQCNRHIRQQPLCIVQPYAGNEYIIKIPEADRRKAVQPEIQYVEKMLLFFRIVSGAHVANTGGDGAEKRIHQSGNVFF